MKRLLSRTVMEALRGRRGLDDNDTSQDANIVRMQPAQIVREVVGWHIGDPSWADAVAEWMLEAGAKPEDF